MAESEDWERENEQTQTVSLSLLPSLCLHLSVIMMEMAEGKGRECWKFLLKSNHGLWNHSI